MRKAPAPLNENRHLTFRSETVCELIADCVVARVFERSWLCAGHAPALAAHSGGGWPRGEACSPADEPAPPTSAATPARATSESATLGRRAHRVFVNGIPDSPFEVRVPQSSPGGVRVSSARGRLFPGLPREQVERPAAAPVVSQGVAAGPTT